MKLIMTVEDPKTRRQAYKQYLGIGVLLQANNSHGGDSMAIIGCDFETGDVDFQKAGCCYFFRRI